MTRILARSLVAAFVLCVLPRAAQGQLTVQNVLSPEQLVNSVLAGQGVAVSNVTFNGQPATTVNDQVAYFEGTNSNIGLSNGVVISTGRAVLVEGPNNYGGLTVSPSQPHNSPDPDLTIVTGSNLQNTVAVLEFDFIPVGDSVKFRFVFGSEEYPEYVCSSFNDGFGFFLSGPGLNGPFTNHAVNLAVVPGTSVPVAINTINPGTPGMFGGSGASCTSWDPNWQNNSVYYVNNTGGATVELDGFTVALTAGAAVQCGQTYHIKMAICNTMDSQLDSAVLIEGGSFTSTGSLDVEVNTPFDMGSIAEGCLPAMVTVTRGDTLDDVMIGVTYAGTGITPEDLANAPSQVMIPAGSTSTTFYLGAAIDDLPEGTEELMIYVTWVSSCGYTVASTATLQIHDYEPMHLETQDLVLNCDHESVPITANVYGGLGAIELNWGDDLGEGNTVYISGVEDGTYTVTAADQCPKTVTAEINVISGCELIIPNVITPNGDGVNDAWQISHRSPSGHSVKIFNRWGNEVFSTSNYANNWRATDMPDGTYFYVIIDGGTGEQYTGHLTVLSNGRR